MDKPDKLDALTSLRFFAAAMIVLAHSDHQFGSMGLATRFSLAQGVSFFFVLSGFILTYNYPLLPTLAEIAAFFKARIARIWPAHIVAIGLLVLLTGNMNVVGLSKGAAIFSGLANFFLFQSMIPLRDVFLSFNGVAWSISTEMFFYFVFPLLIVDTYFGWRIKLSFLLLMVILHLWFAAAWNIPSDESTSSVGLMGLIYVNPLVRIFEFYVGVLACALYTHLRPRINYSVAHFTVIEAAIVILMLFSLYFSKRVVTLLGWHGGLADVISYYLIKVGSFWIFAPLLIIFAFGKGYLSKMLSLKPMILLGEISFSLYLVHVTILKWYQWNSAYFENVPEQSKVAGYWLLSLSIAYLLHKIVENPCRHLILSYQKMNVDQVFQVLFSRRQITHVMLGVGIIGTMVNAPLNGPLLFVSETCPITMCNELANSYRLPAPALFGDYVELSSLRLSTPKPMKAEYSRLELLFNIQTPLPKGYRLAVHLVDANGLTVSQIDTLLVKNRGLDKGMRWLQSIEIPTKWIKQGKSIGFILYSDPRTLLPVKYPQTDFDGHRALFNFSQLSV